MDLSSISDTVDLDRYQFPMYVDTFYRHCQLLSELLNSLISPTSVWWYIFLLFCINKIGECLITVREKS